MSLNRGQKVLTVFYNGTAQRSHTYLGHQLHCVGAGNLLGGSTYYHPMFVFDPITVWLTGDTVYIDPSCRIILPCDVIRNRKKEISRGDKRHGSCGMGLFEAVKRSTNPTHCIYAADFFDEYNLYKKVKKIQKEYNNAFEDDALYNLDNWMRAVSYVLNNCQIQTFDEIQDKFDTIIFEGGQGLLLSQDNIGNFPHLTPSSTGSYNIKKIIASLNLPTDLYYVSRTYMTRHGAGPMESECKKEDINSIIVDKTNEENPWQGALRFGYLNTDTLYERIQRDAAQYKNKVNTNVVFTQLNYTQNKLCVGKNQFEEIKKPDFVYNLFGSDKEDKIFKVE